MLDWVPYFPKHETRVVSFLATLIRRSSCLNEAHNRELFLFVIVNEDIGSTSLEAPRKNKADVWLANWAPRSWK